MNATAVHGKPIDLPLGFDKEVYDVSKESLRDMDETEDNPLRDTMKSVCYVLDPPEEIGEEPDVILFTGSGNIDLGRSNDDEDEK